MLSKIHMKFLLGKKQSMTQIFDDTGKAVSGTLVEAGPLTVVDFKTKAKHGYDAVVLGLGKKKLARAGKARMGIAQKAGQTDHAFEYLREFRVADVKELEGLAIGNKIDVSSFLEGDTVMVTGISKGKGFQGVVKRHGFAGGRRTHGQKHSEREPGSIGVGGVQRVFKGMRMGGRMGSDRISVKNLKVVKIDSAQNLFFISGSIPGVKGTLLEITSTK